jgi:hypothetical protein
MGAPPRKRRLSEKARRALEMLASNERGISEPLMLADGFPQRTLTGLVHAGLAMRYRMRLSADGRMIEVAYVKITPAGRRALAGEGGRT